MASINLELFGNKYRVTVEVSSRDEVKPSTPAPRQWRGITLADIDKQWRKSKDVHPSFGQQLGHFAAGIDRTLKEHNFNASTTK